jgi:probable HAF family extracellular repeat protein
MTNLGLLPGGSTCTATGINASGQVVGYADDASGGGKAFLYQNGTMTSLGTLPGDIYSTAWGINASGQVVGVSGYFTDHAFLYSNGAMTDLSALTGVYGCARAINDSGEAVGLAELTGNINGVVHAFNFTTGTDLGTLGGTSSAAYGINASGQVVGYAAIASGVWHPFLYSNGQMTDLGTLGPSWSNGQAFGINTARQIVGYEEIANTATEHAFLYSGGQMIDLNMLISPTSGWTLQSASSINDSGQIVGIGTTPTGHVEAFLLTPVPEPQARERYESRRETCREVRTSATGVPHQGSSHPSYFKSSSNSAAVCNNITSRLRLF